LSAVFCFECAGRSRSINDCNPLTFMQFALSIEGVNLKLRAQDVSYDQK
jgi:hypothetical protein